MMSRLGVRYEGDTLTTFSKTKPLHTSPHYSDPHFYHKEQTVFGKECNELEYVYSDRIWQWDWNKAEKSAEIANESGHPKKSCLWYEVYLSAFFDKPIEIKHVVAGCNLSNGYPYCVFGYRDKLT